MLVQKRYCDICGKEIPENTKKVKVLCDTDKYEDEEIVNPLRERLGICEIDVCDDCLDRIVSVRRTKSTLVDNDVFGLRYPTDVGNVQ
jgi:ribosome-binding protein aMBF1 (putative translation factor)